MIAEVVTGSPHWIRLANSRLERDKTGPITYLNIPRPYSALVYKLTDSEVVISIGQSSKVLTNCICTHGLVWFVILARIKDRRFGLYFWDSQEVGEFRCGPDASGSI